MTRNPNSNASATPAGDDASAPRKSSKSDNQGVKVSILGRDFFVACDDEQRADLDAAASFLDTQMRTVRDSGKVMGVERCAVMAALNISYELLGLREQADDVTDVQERLKSINEKIDSAMEQTRQVGI